MRIIWSLAFLALSLILPLAPCVSARERGEDELRRDMEFAKNQVYPALVNISVVVVQHVDGRPVRRSGAGSGVIVSPAGHVLTNYHVAGNTRRITCRLPDSEVIEAEVVVHDPMTDLSVLRLKLEERSDRNAPIPFARIGDSDAMEVGDYVLAMGNPLTLSSSMTLGIVSNPKRVLLSFSGNEMEELDLGSGQLTGLFTRWIQHDATIAPGNSGGPLVNLNGEVVGINELGTGAGIGFAIPSNLARRVLNQALARGEIVRGWAGMALYPTRKSGDRRGVIVADVEPGGPAAEAGLGGGDRLLELGGEKLSAETFDGIPLIYESIAERSPGDRLPAVWERGGAAHRGEIVLSRMPTFLPDEEVEEALGLTVRAVTPPMVRRLRLAAETGVLVTGVRPGRAGHRARPPVLARDLITAVNGTPVAGPAELRAAVAAAAKSGTVSLRIKRGEEDLVLVLETEPVPEPQFGGELPRAWLGVRTQVLTPEVARSLGREGAEGFRVTRVHPGTRAADAGIETGDLIVALNGEPLNADSIADREVLRRRIERLTIGGTAKLTVVRNGEEKELTVTLERRPDSSARAETARDEFLECSVREVTFDDRVERRWSPEETGVIVTAVANGGWAGLGGLHTGDLILRFHGREIRSVDDFRQASSKILEERPGHITLLVRRRHRTTVVFLEPDYENRK